MFYTLFYALYQLKGYNDVIDKAAANKALSVIVMLLILAFLVVIFFVSTRTRTKISEVPDRIKNKKALPKMRSKYKFLIYEPSQFPL